MEILDSTFINLKGMLTNLSIWTYAIERNIEATLLNFWSISFYASFNCDN